MEITIKLKIKDVTIELTHDEAQQLAEELSKITDARVDHYHHGFWQGYRWWEPVWTRTGSTSVTVSYLGNRELTS